MLGWAVMFLIIATCGSDLWIWRHRCGISGHRETSVRYSPCAIRDLFGFRLARQTRAVSCNEIRLPLAR